MNLHYIRCKCMNCKSKRDTEFWRIIYFNYPEHKPVEDGA